MFSEFFPNKSSYGFLRLFNNLYWNSIKFLIVINCLCSWGNDSDISWLSARLFWVVSFLAYCYVVTHHVFRHFAVFYFFRFIRRWPLNKAVMMWLKNKLSDYFSFGILDVYCLICLHCWKCAFMWLVVSPKNDNKLGLCIFLWKTMLLCFSGQESWGYSDTPRWAWT